MPVAPENTNQDGFGLVMVLLLILAIATILTPITTRVKTDSLHSTAMIRVEQLKALARAVSLILASDAGRDSPGGTGKTIVANSTPHRCHVGAVVVDFALQNHVGLIDLNHAPVFLLSDGFRSLGYDGDMADRLANTAISFRQYKASGAGLGDLEVIGGLKHAPFETVSELFDIRELRRIPLRRLTRTFTIYSGSAQVALDTAPTALAEMLMRDIRATEKGETAGTRPGDALAISVRVAEGAFEGRFDGVYRVDTSSSIRMLESWNYDIGDNEEDLDDEGSCADHFGQRIVDLVEMAV